MLDPHSDLTVEEEPRSNRIGREDLLFVAVTAGRSAQDYPSRLEKKKAQYCKECVAKCQNMPRVKNGCVWSGGMLNTCVIPCAPDR